METFNIHKARNQLSRLVNRAARGEGFIIAKAGKPMVMVVPLNGLPARGPQAFGFLKEEVRIPYDFDRIGEREIQDLFYGS